METSPTLAPRFDRALSRVDQELARSCADYDEAGTALEQHRAKMETETGTLAQQLAQQREALEPCLTGDAPPPADLEEKGRQYLDTAAELAQRRMARGLIRTA